MSGGLLTCDRLGVKGRFAPGHENDIALASIGIVVFEEEELVDTIILQGRDFDNGADGTSQTTFDDKILLAPDLKKGLSR